jgi:hypothetical protein
VFLDKSIGREQGRVEQSLLHTALIDHPVPSFFRLGFDFDNLNASVATARWAHMVRKAQFMALWAGN